MIIRDYCEQLYTNTLDNPKEMDKFLEMYNLPRPNHKEIEILNIPIAFFPSPSEICKFHPRLLHNLTEFYYFFDCQDIIFPFRS